MKRKAGFCLIAGLVTAAITGSAAHATPTETVLYAFTGGKDGGAPQAGLIADAAGNLYGTGSLGGGSSNCSGGCGVVFELSPPATSTGKWSETVLYPFKGGTDGATPVAGLLSDASGALYGTTVAGGSSNCTNGCGTVFKLIPPGTAGRPWTEKILYRFTGGGDGDSPLAGTIMDTSGALYGITGRYPPVGACLSSACGTAFKLTAPARTGGPWTKTILHVFLGGTDGSLPIGGLVADKHGALYGSTALGGTTNCFNFGCGVIYKLSPPTGGNAAWTEAVIHAFTGGPPLGGTMDGAYAGSDLIIDLRGNLYGTTYYGPGNGGGGLGDGAVFKLSPPAAPTTNWAESVLYGFQGGTDGASPLTGRLLVGPYGALYGTTPMGGVVNCGSCGVVYKLTPPAAGSTQWTEMVVHAFQGGTDGNNPTAGLIRVSNILYGTTSAGGPSNKGTVFKLKP